MRRLVWIGALVLATVVLGRARGADPHPCEPAEGGWLKNWHPVGGWDPYGGGLLHWWNPHCFPCAGGPDDYCRKTIPCVCWPPYPPYFRWSAPCNAPAAPPTRPAGQ
jgi:hypothetical protein